MHMNGYRILYALTIVYGVVIAILAAVHYSELGLVAVIGGAVIGAGWAFTAIPRRQD